MIIWLHKGESMRKRYSCIVDTMYSLMLYLLMMDMKQIQQTRYYFGSAVPMRVNQFFTHVMRFDCNAISKASKNYRRWFRFRMWLVHLCRIAGTEIYAQDHLSYAQQLICGANYILLEDAPGVYTRIINGVLYRPQKMTMYSRVANWASRGRIGLEIFGTNKQCLNRIVTEKSDTKAEVLKGRKYELVSLKELWSKAGEEKKEFVLRVFDVDMEMIAGLRGLDTIILTQPFCTDFGMRPDELVGIYRPYVEKYSAGGVVLKIHPRDKVDYTAYFHNVRILNSKAPMQLLSLLGVTFKRAITISSSAISAFSKDTEIISLGSNVHPKIAAFYEVSQIVNS